MTHRPPTATVVPLATALAGTDTGAALLEQHPDAVVLIEENGRVTITDQAGAIIATGRAERIDR